MARFVWRPTEYNRVLPGNELVLTDVVANPSRTVLSLFATGSTGQCIGDHLDLTTRDIIGAGETAFYSLRLLGTTDTATRRIDGEPLCDGGVATGTYLGDTLYVFDPSVARVFGNYPTAWGHYGYDNPADYAQTWTYGEVYTANDTVWQGHIFRALSTHTAYGGNRPGSGPVWTDVWAETRQGLYTYEWASGTAYTVGDYVYSVGQTYYRCTGAHTASTDTKPGDGDAWETVWTQLPYGPTPFAQVQTLRTAPSGHLLVCDAGNARVTAYNALGGYAYTLGLGRDVALQPTALDTHNGLWVADRTILRRFSPSGVELQSVLVGRSLYHFEVSRFNDIVYGQRAAESLDGRLLIGYVFNLTLESQQPIYIENTTDHGGRWFFVWDDLTAMSNGACTLWGTNGTVVVKFTFSEDETPLRTAPLTPEHLASVASDTEITLTATVDGPDGTAGMLRVKLFINEAEEPSWTTDLPVTLTGVAQALSTPYTTIVGTNTYRFTTAFVTVDATGEEHETPSTVVHTFTARAEWLPELARGGSGKLYVTYADPRGLLTYTDPLYNDHLASINVKDNLLTDVAGNGTELLADGESSLNVFIGALEQPFPSPEGRYVHFVTWYAGAFFCDETGCYGPPGWVASTQWYTVDLETGLLDQRFISTSGIPTVEAVSEAVMSKDGRYIAYCTFPNPENAVPSQVWRIDTAQESWLPERYAGAGEVYGSSGNDGPALEAQMMPIGLAYHPDGSLFIYDGASHTIRRVNPDTGIITAPPEYNPETEGFYAPFCFDSQGRFITMRHSIQPPGDYVPDTLVRYTASTGAIELIATGTDTTGNPVGRVHVDSVNVDGANNILVSGVYGTAYTPAIHGPRVWAYPESLGNAVLLLGPETLADESGTYSPDGEALGAPIFDVSRPAAIGNILRSAGGVTTLTDEVFGLSRMVFAVNGESYYSEAANGVTWSLPIRIGSGEYPTLTAERDGTLTVVATITPDTAPTKATYTSRDSGRSWASAT